MEDRPISHFPDCGVSGKIGASGRAESGAHSARRSGISAPARAHHTLTQYTEPGRRFAFHKERRIRMRPSTMAFVFALFLGLTVFVQPAAAQADASDIIAVGEMAPDITVTGATRYGVLQDPVRLSDLRGEVVVIAFFFRARTPG